MQSINTLTFFYSVDGGWSDWSYIICQTGVQLRYRVCDNPIPQNGGSQCEGLNIKVKNIYLSNDECKTNIPGKDSSILKLVTS